MDTNALIKSWLDGPIDEKMKAEIRRLQKEDPAELQEAFSTSLSFGTGGIREKMGVGIGRLNRYTIRIATQGLARYLKRSFSHSSVFISYDSRHGSREFAVEAAQVLAANSIRAIVTKELRSTPYVSFCCRELKCQAAIMITASHNPPEYNGYKVYWEDGAQVVPPHDSGIVEEVKKITDPFSIPMKDDFEWADERLQAAYINAIAPYQSYPEDNHALGSQLKIVYSPLYGCGINLTPLALKSWGFTSISLVEKQAVPNGDFPTARSPNPEDPAALKMGVEQMIKEKADIFFSNDPDADRIGVVVMHQGVPVALDGNELAVLALSHILNGKKLKGKLPKNGANCTTIVTTDLFTTISESFHISTFRVLTGFKYIGEKISEWEETQSHEFIFGAEESQGYLVGTYARDKDGSSALCLFAEIALQMKKEGLTLVDYLHDLYHRYGVFRGKTSSITFEGRASKEKMGHVMQELREKPPKELFGQKVTEIEDYLTSEKLKILEGTKERLTLPSSNVLLFILGDKSKVIFRPSGTEPKLKIYAMVQKRADRSIEECIKECDELLTQRLATLKNEITRH